MRRGFICLWRKSLDSQAFQDEGLWKVWTWCLLTASHKNHWVKLKVGKQVTEVVVNPGQFVFGRKKAAKLLAMKESTVWYRMRKLERMGNINILSNTHYSLVTICNWRRYQAKKKRVQHPHMTAGRQPADTYNNGNNDNNGYNNKGKKGKRPCETYPIDLIVEEE